MKFYPASFRHFLADMAQGIRDLIVPAADLTPAPIEVVHVDAHDLQLSEADAIDYCRDLIAMRQGVYGVREFLLLCEVER